MEKAETIDIELTDEEFLALAKEAHNLDITFNQYISKTMRDMIELYRRTKGV